MNQITIQLIAHFKHIKTENIPCVDDMYTKRKLMFIFCAASGLFSLLCVWSYFLRSVPFYWEDKPNDTPSSDNIMTAALKSHEPNESFDENLIVIYNRVPKTGSTSFINLAYDLCKKNHFYVLHINITANMHVLSLENQVNFVRNITAWNTVKPALYHGHMAYLDFSKFQMRQKPIYINLIRKPLDRLVSYYYFLRTGDNYRPNLVRKRSGDTMTLDECVRRKQPDCDVKYMWLQVPFFCGHSAECWKPGSLWALEQAKANLVNNYFLVGLTEHMEEFIYLLEMSLPRIFSGIVDHYRNSGKSHLRQTQSKIKPDPETIAEIKRSDVWKIENEFYEFARQQFNYTFKLQNKIKLQGKSMKQTFFYEKIRPKF